MEPDNVMSQQEHKLNEAKFNEDDPTMGREGVKALLVTEEFVNYGLPAV